MRRRAALEVMAATMILAPWARAQATAQAARPRRLVVLWMGPNDVLRAEVLPPLRSALASLGYVEGRNVEVAIEVSELEAIAAAAASVAAGKPDVVVTMGTVATRAMMLAAPRIPVVTSVADPVGSGFARTLARPGGNVTGLSQGKLEAARKGLEALRDLAPRLSRLAIVGPVGSDYTALVSRAAVDVGLEPVGIVVPGGDIIAGLARAREARASGVYLDAVLDRDGYVRVAAAAIKSRLPVVTNHEEGVDAGLLASYNSQQVDWAARTAAMVDRMLRGGDPATTPFELPGRYRLVLNRATAAALGLAIPPEVALRVDRFVG